jgi:hypothetical protein
MRSVLLFITLVMSCVVYSQDLESGRSELGRIRVSDDQSHFVDERTSSRFIPWGVNYDHDRSGRLLDEYWVDDWSTVESDFREMKSLGANCVRVHLQLGKFMDTPESPNQASLRQLRKLLQLAESTGLYLNITGLACYHKANIPPWYDSLDEQARWDVQAVFWSAVAEVCKDSPAVFCYDLMNEPVLPGAKPETDWLLGELGGKYFVQRLSLDLAGRTREQVAKAWVDRLVDAIELHDKDRMITVGVIPWVFVFGAGKPIFYSDEVGERLDFVSVHFYPKAGEVDKALTALKAYEVGKPLVIEEMFPLACSEAELVEFVRRSSKDVDGWFSFYWGATAEELRATKPPSIGDAITASWLEKFHELSSEMIRP